MRNIIKLLSKSNKILFAKSITNINSGFFNAVALDDNTIIDCNRQSIKLPYTDEISLGYENVVVSNPNLNTELIIFQDYGDYETEIPKGYKELNKRLIYCGFSYGSLGWYDGYLQAVFHVHDCILCIRLFRFHKPNIEAYCGCKRPYSYAICIEKKSNLAELLNTKLTFVIEFAEESADTPKKYIVQSHIRLKGIININNLNRLTKVYYSQTCPDELTDTELASNNLGDPDFEDSIDEFITRDNLAKERFSFNAKHLTWTKDNVVIYENGGEWYNVCFWIVTKDGNKEHVFHWKDITNYTSSNKK